MGVGGWVGWRAGGEGGGVLSDPSQVTAAL